MSSRITRRFVKPLVSIGLVALLLWWVDLGQVVAIIAAADVVLLLGALAVALADRIVMIAKWWPLLRVQRLPIGWWRAVRVYLAANFASLFLPSSVGADMVRALALGRRHDATMEVGASIAVERISGIVGMAAILTLAFAIGLGKAVGVEQFGLYIAAFSVAAVVLAWLPFSEPGRRLFQFATRPVAARRWFSGIDRFAGAYGGYRSHPRIVIGVTVASALEQLFPVVVYAIVAASLGIGIGFQALLVAVPITMFAGRIPIAIGGIGVEEAVFIFLLGLFGVAPAAALSLSIGRRIVESLGLLPGVLFWSDLAPARNSQAGVEQPAATLAAS